MPFDPLYWQTDGSPALLRELGVPTGVGVQIWRPEPAWQAAHARHFAGYQLMALISGAPDTRGQWPPTWAPGDEPYIWLVRLRYGDHRAVVEWRDSPAEGPKLQTWHPWTWEGQLLRLTAAEAYRARRGEEALLDLLPKVGRKPNPELFPHEATELVEAWVQEMVRLFAADRDMPCDKLTQGLLAPRVGLSKRSVERRVHDHRLDWEAMKRRAWAESRASRPRLSSPEG